MFNFVSLFFVASTLFFGFFKGVPEIPLVYCILSNYFRKIFQVNNYSKNTFFGQMFPTCITGGQKNQLSITQEKFQKF